MKKIAGVNDFVVKFANVNGTGSASANHLFAKGIFRMGIPVSPRNIFPSNIQGLPTWYEVRVSAKGYLGRREGGVVRKVPPRLFDRAGDRDPGSADQDLGRHRHAALRVDSRDRGLLQPDPRPAPSPLTTMRLPDLVAAPRFALDRLTHTGLSDDNDVLQLVLQPRPGRRFVGLSALGAGETALTLAGAGAEQVFFFDLEAPGDGEGLSEAAHDGLDRQAEAVRDGETEQGVVDVEATREPDPEIHARAALYRDLDPGSANIFLD